jgi:hypothetical protein
MGEWRATKEGLAPMTTEAELLRRIKRVKATLAGLGDLRPGSLSEQYNTCSGPGCRCKTDPSQRHGPYHQLSFSRRGRSHSENVAPHDVAAVQAQIDNYRRLRDLVDEWIDAGIELDRLRRPRRR